MLEGLDYGLSGMSRRACFLLGLVVLGGKLTGHLLCCWAVHVQTGVGGRGHPWVLTGLQCCRARMGGERYLWRHLRWMDWELLVVVVGCYCWLWGVVALRRLYHQMGKIREVVVLVWWSLEVCVCHGQR
jgi:hypothetical protein